MLPELVTMDLEPLLDVSTFDDLQPVDASLSVADLDTPAEAQPENTQPLLQALSRGGGPFGPRDAPVRLILIPDSRYSRDIDRLKEAIHQSLSLDVYTAAQALQKETPTYLGSARDRAIAEHLVQRLRDLGLRVLILERSRWLEGAEPEAVVKARSDDRHITFVREDGSSFEVERASLRWAALGEIQPDGTPPLGAAEAAGDDARSLQERLGTYQLLDLLRRRDRRPIRLRSDRFDFSCLGDQRALSANMNLRTMLSWLSRDPSNPELLIPVDEAFRRVPHLPGPPIEVPGSSREPIQRREVEFTEYVLLLDARHHL